MELRFKNKKKICVKQPKINLSQNSEKLNRKFDIEMFRKKYFFQTNFFKFVTKIYHKNVLSETF